MPHTFKVGDKVRRCAEFEDHKGGLPKGEIGSVSNIELGAIHIEGFGTWDHASKWLELVPAVVVKESNPKEAIGSTKLNFSLVPSTLGAYAAQAFSEGAYKYGAYNWRVAGVRASTYNSAFQRHVQKWWNGEDFDPKTKVHHLANAIACLGIILDADECGKLTDDRPPKVNLNGLIERGEAVCQHLQEMSKDLKPHHHTALDVK